MRGHGTESIAISVQTEILGELLPRKPRSIVSVNRLIGRIRHNIPQCTMSDETLARSIRDTAKILCLVPVFNFPSSPHPPSLHPIRSPVPYPKKAS